MSSKDRIHITAIEPLSANWNKLEKIDFQYVRANGDTQSLTREIYHVDDGASVLLYHSQRRTVVLVRQFRLPAYLRGRSGYLLETPAGFLDGADPVARMKQEVEEETGYRIASMHKVFEALMVPGCVTHAVHCFVAGYTPEDKVSDGGGLMSEGEDIEVVELSIDDALAMISRGEITDGKTIMLLQYAALNLLRN
ncbi:NUDIX domain-containing protein [Paraburkholderia sediminicola]|uniref:NUDIX domain-containing protein n=1 Tax=Paraburkholderia sediminicola TaxID=458836 RepID=UPI0038BCEEBD